MKYDSEKLRAAFKKRKKRKSANGPGFGLETISEQTGLVVSTVHRIVTQGLGKPHNVEVVAKALGFKGQAELRLERTA